MNNVVNSLGRWSTATEFVPLFPATKARFMPLEIKRVYDEDQETKTQELPGSAVPETESGQASEN
jgi:hypothetical protein